MFWIFFAFHQKNHSGVPLSHKTSTLYVAPKKHLGQHFLKDLNVAQKIAQTLNPSEINQVLEIGPGTGVLTQFLLNESFKLKVCEIDSESVIYLKSNFPALQNQIIEGDFLKLDLKDIFQGEAFALIGNYPYNISSQILFKVVENKDLIPFCSGMFQKEVAWRVAQGPGSKDYGILSVLCQAFYKVEYLFTVDEHVFNPPPKVKSGVMSMKRLEKDLLDGVAQADFFQVVKTAFNQRRKTLRNSLSSLNIPEGSKHLPIFGRRPEQLAVEEFVELTKILKGA